MSRNKSVVRTGSALVLLGVAFFGASCRSQEARIKIDPAVTYQTLTGWEVTSWVMDQPEALLTEKADTFNDLVVEAGINRLRLEIRSGAENTGYLWKPYVAGKLTEEQFKPSRYTTLNDNDDPNVINWAGFDFSELDYRIEQNVLPLRQRLAARGERLVINLCYVSFINQAPGARYDHRNPEEYAEFVLATYLHIRDKYGFSPDTWEVILEPDMTGAWDGTSIGKAIVASAKRLKANGFTPRFVAPSVENMDNAGPYIDQIAAVPGAMAYVQEFSYHRYNGNNARNLRAIVERARKYGKRTGMLEWWFNNGTPEVLYEDLTDGMNSSWQGQVMREVAVNEADAKHPVLELTPQSRLRAQVFRYARVGAKRVEAQSSSGRFKTLAFMNPGRGAAVVVMAESEGRLRLEGLPAADYQVSHATEQKASAPTPAGHVGADGVLEVSAPEAGIYTVFDARLAH